MTVCQLEKKSANEQLAVYGVSYGTYLLNRVSQLYLNQVDTSIFDSVVKVNISATNIDDQFNEAAEIYISKCAETVIHATDDSIENLPDKMSMPY